MSTVLAYEVPTYAETRCPPWAVRVLILVVGVLLAAVTTAMLTDLHRWPGWGLSTVIVVELVVVAAMVLLPASLRGRTQVFPDRLELSLAVAGLQVWRRRVRWSKIHRCDVRCRLPGPLRPRFTRYAVWGWRPGRTAFMFGGDGVAVHVRDAGQLLIGSNHPDRLSVSIYRARAADPRSFGTDRPSPPEGSN